LSDRLCAIADHLAVERMSHNADVAEARGTGQIARCIRLVQQDYVL
jgi:hypothetical protein